MGDHVVTGWTNAAGSVEANNTFLPFKGVCDCVYVRAACVYACICMQVACVGVRVDMLCVRVFEDGTYVYACVYVCHCVGARVRV